MTGGIWSEQEDEPAPDPEPAYSATSAFDQFGHQWHVYWETFLDGRYLTARERFADHPAVFSRRWPAQLRDVLAEYEAELTSRRM